MWVLIRSAALEKVWEYQLFFFFFGLKKKSQIYIRSCDINSEYLDKHAWTNRIDQDQTEEQSELGSALFAIQIHHH